MPTPYGFSSARLRHAPAFGGVRAMLPGQNSSLIGPGWPSIHYLWTSNGTGTYALVADREVALPFQWGGPSGGVDQASVVQRTTTTANSLKLALSRWDSISRTWGALQGLGTLTVGAGSITAYSVALSGVSLAYGSWYVIHFVAQGGTTELSGPTYYAPNPLGSIGAGVPAAYAYKAGSYASGPAGGAASGYSLAENATPPTFWFRPV